MKIQLSNLGKRYNRDWIFKNISYEFHSGEAYVILGSNGSGKSTLLQLIGGNQLASEGKIVYEEAGQKIAPEKIIHHLSFASPYLELIEEYTLRETIAFHAQFKKYFEGISIEKFIDITGLTKSSEKELKYYSSGMKQRVRLALAILSNTPLLLLDEPTSNLDKKGIDWYNQLIQDYSKNRIILVCSNHQQHEYGFCSKQLTMENYK